jgi:hypothetical protein
MVTFLGTGIDGFFTDQSDIGVLARSIFLTNASLRVLSRSGRAQARVMTTRPRARPLWRYRIASGTSASG